MLKVLYRFWLVLFTFCLLYDTVFFRTDGYILNDERKSVVNDIENNMQIDHFCTLFYDTQNIYKYIRVNSAIINIQHVLFLLKIQFI